MGLGHCTRAILKAGLIAVGLIIGLATPAPAADLGDGFDLARTAAPRARRVEAEPFGYGVGDAVPVGPLRPARRVTGGPDYAGSDYGLAKPSFYGMAPRPDWGRSNID